MSQKDDAGTERGQVPPSAVHRQRDDHLGPEEAPYDAESGLQRLRGWMGEEEPPDEARPQVEPVSQAERLRLAGMRLDAVERLAQKRVSNARLALGAVVLVSVLAGLGLLFRLSYVPARVAMPVLVAVSAIDGAMTLAVVVLYRSAMRGLHDDLRLAFGEQAGWREKPDQAGQETTRPAKRRRGGRPLVVLSEGGRYPPLLTFLATVAFLGFAAACVVAFARDSLMPFTITSIVLAGLFLISVLPVVIPAIWAGEGPRRAAQGIFYVMLGGQPVSYGEITAGHAETAGLPPAAERDAGSTAGALPFLFQDAPLGGRVGSVGKHALAVQLRELVQVRYPRRLVIRGRRRRRGRGGWSDGRGWLDRYGSTGAGRSRGLLARGVHPELTPEPVGLRHVPGLGEPARAERRRRAGHRAYVAQLGVADLKAPAAHGTDQVVVRPVRHDGHEVQAHRLLRPYVVEKHLVMTVRAHARRDLALVFRTACPKTEDHHHAAIEAEAPGAAVHPWQVRTGAVSGH